MNNDEQLVSEGPSATELRLMEETRWEDFYLTQEQKEAHAQQAKRFVARLEQGQGEQDDELRSVDESLMPKGAIVSTEHVEELAAELSEELCDAKAIKTLNDKRVRYDISVSVSRIELDVDKKVMINESGERTVVCASTDDYGPARYSVTWGALATLAILVGQFAMPLNRLATLFSCVGKQFTAAGLSCLLLKQEKRWSKATKLGTAARYIVNHWDKLTAYLDYPRLEPTNNMLERMLRTEKLTSMLQKIRRHKSFHSRNSLQTKGVLAFSGPHLGWTKLRPKKSSVHPYFADSFAFLLDVFCNIEVNREQQHVPQKP